jgi:excisionase family DNA binding protein
MPTAAAPLLVTPKEGQRLLSLGQTKLYGLIKSGKLEIVKIGRATRIKRASLDALVAGGAI